jgi:hypothetical protein
MMLIAEMCLGALLGALTILCLMIVLLGLCVVCKAIAKVLREIETLPR